MAINKTRILVTGASGFLGGNILKGLMQIEDVIVIAACRDKAKLPATFMGEVRQGDLRDKNYNQSVVKDIDIICHAGTWAAMWEHNSLEIKNFYNPTLELINNAKSAGVKRFIMTSTVAISKPTRLKTINDDFSTAAYTGFWPHLDRLIDIECFMKKNASAELQMISMRLGHFIGENNSLGLVPALVPRLKTYLVPWLAGGKSRVPLITDEDLSNAFSAACLAKNLNNFESFNICGKDFPTMKEVISYISNNTGFPKPVYSVPYFAGYLFAWLMERLFPLLPGKAPFLTRAIVHLAEDWYCDCQYAKKKLNFHPNKSWEVAMDEALADLKKKSFSWPFLAQKIN